MVTEWQCDNFYLGRKPARPGRTTTPPAGVSCHSWVCALSPNTLARPAWDSVHSLHAGGQQQDGAAASSSLVPPLTLAQMSSAHAGEQCTTCYNNEEQQRAMLTMTVVQHERGAVGGFSKEVVKGNEDVLSCLHHLHRTLQECHWRVQSVDQALSAQDNKGLDGQQNQAGNKHRFQFHAGKDYSLQNQPGEGYNLWDETGKDDSLQNEAGKDDNFQDEADKELNLEDQFWRINEQTKGNNIQDNPEEDHNLQNEIKEEFKSENLSRKDHHHQKPAQEKASQQDIKREDESLPLQDEGNNLLDLYSDIKDQSTKDNDLQKAAMKDHTELPHPRPDHYIHNQTNDEESLLNYTKSMCAHDCTNPLHGRKFRGLIRQDGIDDYDSALVNSLGTVSATLEPHHIFRDAIVSATSAVPYIMTDDIQHQLLGQNLKCSDKVAKEVSPENCSESSVVRCRSDHKKECLGSKAFNEQEINLLKIQKTNDASPEDQKEDKSTDGKRTVGKVSLDTFPEVTQRMDVIWEALENLRSHFFALHYSIMDPPSHCLNQEHNKSFDNSDITLLKEDIVTEPSDLYEEHHARCEDEAGMLHQGTSETTQLFQSFCEQPSYKKTLPRRLSQPVHHSLSRSHTRSCTFHQQPASEASPSDNTAHRGTFLRGWREGCLCIGMVLLLLLLLLFLASCLLLVLPVVSVSVRTAGGLPAF